jgi:hypothetical protein
MVDANGILLAVVAAGADRHDSPLLASALDPGATKAIGLPEQASVHLDRAYDARKTRWLLEEPDFVGVIAKKGVPAPLVAGLRWVVERTNSSWHKKRLWCTEREDLVIDFWIALYNVVIVVRRLVREGWVRYRWEDRPSRKP